MRCLKCGVNVDHPEVFCESCRRGMAECPVSRETPVVILPRPKPAPVRPRTAKPEELLAAAKKKQKALRWFCAVLVVLVLALGSLVVYQYLQRGEKPIGQNYKSNVSTQSSSTAGEIVP